VGARASRPHAALQGQVFREAPAFLLALQASGRPARPLLPVWEKAYRGRFFGKPLRAIFRFRHQDAQTPPSPRVGEGGWGDAHRGGFFGKPLRTISRFSHQDAQTPPSPLVGEGGWGDEGRTRTGM
jgi:hypothetical protein